MVNKIRRDQRDGPLGLDGTIRRAGPIAPALFLRFADFMANNAAHAGTAEGTRTVPTHHNGATNGTNARPDGACLLQSRP